MVAQLVFEILYIMVYFKNLIFILPHVLHFIILCKLLSVFYFQWYRLGDLPMLLEIELVLMIQSEIWNILITYYFSYLVLVLEAKNHMGIGRAHGPNLVLLECFGTFIKTIHGWWTYHSPLLIIFIFILVKYLFVSLCRIILDFNHC